MKWTIAIFFIFIFNLSSSAQKVVKYEDLEEINGVFYLKDSKTPFTGKCITTFPNGKLGMGGYIKNGLRDGEWIWFYENGNKKRFCVYKNGVKHGTSIFYYKNGQKKSEIIFDNDKNIRQTSYDEKGNKINNPSFSSFR
ncbi:MAG: toxin-antitoxin system YwqK family antitoxin [Bacteroidales bacterium]